MFDVFNVVDFFDLLDLTVHALAFPEQIFLLHLLIALFLNWISRIIPQTGKQVDQTYKTSGVNKTYKTFRPVRHDFTYLSIFCEIYVQATLQIVRLR